MNKLCCKKCKTVNKIEDTFCKNCGNNLVIPKSKKILKLIISFLCFLIGILFLIVALDTIKDFDPWGLTFTFAFLPILLISIITICYSIYSMINVFKNNKVKITIFEIIVISIMLFAFIEALFKI